VAAALDQAVAMLGAIQLKAPPTTEMPDAPF
jgi:hypothetical protein